MSARDRILTAASQEIVQHGYAGSSLSCIAAHLGVTKGALVRQFPSKEHIAYGIFETFDQAVAEERQNAEQTFGESGIRAMLRFLLGLGTRSNSCLQISAAVALATDRTSPVFGTAQFFDSWRRSMYSFVALAQLKGELAESVSPSELTDFIAAVNLGETVMESRATIPPGSIPGMRHIVVILASYGVPNVGEMLQEVSEEFASEELMVLGTSYSG